MKIVVISGDEDIIEAAIESAESYQKEGVELVPYDKLNGNWSLEQNEDLMIFSHGMMADKLNEYDPFISADKDAFKKIIKNAESLPDERYNAEQLYKALKDHLPGDYKGRVFLQACETADVNWEVRDGSNKYPDSFAGSLGREFAKAGQNIKVKGRLGSPSLEEENREFLALDSQAWKTRAEHDKNIDADDEEYVAKMVGEVPEESTSIKSAENEYVMPEPSSPSEEEPSTPVDGPSEPLDGSNSSSESEPEPPNELERPGGPEGAGPELGPGPER